MISRNSITGPFGMSLAALALAALVLVLTLPSLFAAMFTGGTGSSKPSEAVDKLMARHDENLKTYQARINGRSPFFKPPPIYVPPPAREPEKEAPPPPPPPPPPISTVYGGPSLTAIFGDEAWFKAPTTADKPFTLKVGETEPKSGVKLLSTDAPWTVRVAHKGGQYTVGFTSAMFDPKKSESHFTPSPKLNLPIPGLNIMPLPTMPTTAAAETGGAAASASHESDQNEPATPPTKPPGRLRAMPLDGSEPPPAADREREKAREASGESADDDDEKAESTAAQTQPAPAKPVNPPPPQHVQEATTRPGIAPQAPK